MSNKKKNYNKMYDSEDKQVAPEEIIEPIEEVIEPVEEAIEQPVVETKPETVTGVVSNCSKLNVREQMNATSTILCVLPVSSEVKVIAGEVHDDWYHVFTASGVEGFCMKKYIAIKA